MHTLHSRWHMHCDEGVLDFQVVLLNTKNSLLSWLAHRCRANVKLQLDLEVKQSSHVPSVQIWIWLKTEKSIKYFGGPLPKNLFPFPAFFFFFFINGKAWSLSLSHSCTCCYLLPFYLSTLSKIPLTLSHSINLLSMKMARFLLPERKTTSFAVF